MHDLKVFTSQLRYALRASEEQIKEAVNLKPRVEYRRRSAIEVHNLALRGESGRIYQRYGVPKQAKTQPTDPLLLALAVMSSLKVAKFGLVPVDLMSRCPSQDCTTALRRAWSMASLMRLTRSP
jgi:hypothetical protein